MRDKESLDKRLQEVEMSLATANKQAHRREEELRRQLEESTHDTQRLLHQNASLAATITQFEVRKEEDGEKQHLHQDVQADLTRQHTGDDDSKGRRRVEEGDVTTTTSCYHRDSMLKHVVKRQGRSVLSRSFATWRTAVRVLAVKCELRDRCLRLCALKLHRVSLLSSWRTWVASHFKLLLAEEMSQRTNACEKYSVLRDESEQVQLLHGLQVSELRQRVDDLNSQLLSKHRAVENMATQLTLLEEEKRKLAADLQTSEQQRDVLVEKLSQLVDADPLPLRTLSRRTSDGIVSSGDAAVETLPMTLMRELEGQCDHAKAQNAQLAEDLSALQAKCAETEREKERLMATVLDLKARMDKEHTEHQALVLKIQQDMEKHVAKINHDMEHSMSQEREAQARVQQLERSLCEEKERSQPYVEQLKGIGQHATKLEEKLHIMRDGYTALQEENQALRMGAGDKEANKKREALLLPSSASKTSLKLIESGHNTSESVDVDTQAPSIQQKEEQLANPDPRHTTRSALSSVGLVSNHNTHISPPPPNGIVSSADFVSDHNAEFSSTKNGMDFATMKKTRMAKEKTSVGVENDKASNESIKDEDSNERENDEDSNESDSVSSSSDDESLLNFKTSKKDDDEDLVSPVTSPARETSLPSFSPTTSPANSPVYRKKVTASMVSPVNSDLDDDNYSHNNRHKGGSDVFGDISHIPTFMNIPARETSSPSFSPTSSPADSPAYKTKVTASMASPVNSDLEDDSYSHNNRHESGSDVSEDKGDDKTKVCNTNLSSNRNSDGSDNGNSHSDDGVSEDGVEDGIQENESGGKSLNDLMATMAALLNESDSSEDD
jgi:hypothetical protein